MQARKSTSTRGGRRPGAGRKPNPDKALKAWTSLPPTLHAWLAQLYGGDMAEGLRDTVRQRHAQETAGGSS